MIQRLPAKSLYRLVNRTQLDVVERLHTQFPETPWHVIYEKVNEARVTAAKLLPDLTAYADTLEQHARALLVATISSQSSMRITRVGGVHPGHERAPDASLGANRSDEPPLVPVDLE
jgi:hypothetical protein